METQPDTLFEDQVLVITYRTRDGFGPLQCKLANCLCISSKEVEEEIKGLSPAERGFISVSDRLEMSSWLNQLASQQRNTEHLSPHFPGQVELVCAGGGSRWGEGDPSPGVNQGTPH